MFHCTLVTSCCSWSWCWICASCQPGVVPRRWPPQTGGTWRWFARWGCSLRPLRKAREMNHLRQENPHLTVFSFFSPLDVLLFSSDNRLDAQKSYYAEILSERVLKNLIAETFPLLRNVIGKHLWVSVSIRQTAGIYWAQTISEKTVQMEKKKKKEIKEIFDRRSGFDRP